MADAKKLLIIATAGPEDAEKATIPFVMGTAAQASGIEVKIGFQGKAVMLAKKSCLPHVFASNFPSLAELVEMFTDAGGKILLCGPCVNSRKIPAEEFIEGASVVNAPTFVNEVMNSTQTIVY